MSPSDDLLDYYRRRAREYESIYFRPHPERLEEIEDMARAVRSWLKDRDVLEIAAGTGWWTVHGSSVARSYTATDANEEMLTVAKLKPLEKVRFQTADAFKLEEIEGSFDGAIANFWLSHVARAQIPDFLSGLHKRLQPGSHVFMADNLYDPTWGGPFIQEPNNPDTYRIRTLEDGTEYKILKNYFSEQELRDFLKGMQNIQIHMGAYWWAMYETP